MSEATRLQAALRAALAAAADPIRAAQMQAYMRSSMPFFGVPMPKVRAISKAVAAAHPPTSKAMWLDVARTIWDGAVAREERYFCETWLGLRAARSFQTVDVVTDLYAHCIQTGAWWDLVDWLAIHRVGDVLLAHRAATTPVVRRFLASDDLWLRRTAIICQNRHGAQTDLALLFDAIAAADETAPPSRDTGTWNYTAADERFFRRKAIGWALRDLRKHRPDIVDDYIAEHRERLSGLSVREALKHADDATRRRLL